MLTLTLNLTLTISCCCVSCYCSLLLLRTLAKRKTHLRDPQSYMIIPRADLTLSLPTIAPFSLGVHPIISGMVMKTLARYHPPPPPPLKKKTTTTTTTKKNSVHCDSRLIADYAQQNETMSNAQLSCPLAMVFLYSRPNNTCLESSSSSLVPCLG